MSLVELLGLDPEDFDWQDLAACAGMPRKAFYEKYETDTEHAKAIDQMCLACPVMAACAMAGQDGEYGVWGGIYWNGNGQMDETKNAHKGPEFWEQYRERIQNGG